MSRTNHTAYSSLQQFGPRALPWILSLLLLIAPSYASAAGPNPPAHHDDTLSTSPWQAQIESLAAVGDELRAPPTPSAGLPAICVIVRTFWGHGGSTLEHRRQGLRSLLASLQAQQNSR